MYTVIEGMFVWYKLHTTVILWDSSGLKFMYIIIILGTQIVLYDIYI